MDSGFGRAFDAALYAVVFLCVVIALIVGGAGYWIGFRQGRKAEAKEPMYQRSVVVTTNLVAVRK